MLLTRLKELLIVRKPSYNSIVDVLFLTDDYAKDGEPGGSDLDVVFTMILCATNVLIW